MTYLEVINNTNKTQLIMKKLFLAIPLVALMLSVSVAQETESKDSDMAPALISKKGFKILPEKGDYALGFDAVPMVNFALNAVKLLNDTGDDAQHPGFVSGFNNVIVGKYFLKDNMAIRGRFGFNSYSLSQTEFFNNPHDVFTNPADPDKWGEVKDVETNSGSDFFVSLGMEYRRGHNRLQGFYGGEVLIGAGSSVYSQKYGVEMNQEAIDNGYTNANGIPVSAGRVLKDTDGVSLTMGVRGFVGVEYFVAPKISLAAEFGWGMGLTTEPRGKVKVESWNYTDNKSEVNTTKGNQKESLFSFSVDDGVSRGLGSSGSLSILFHF